jgi:glycosyltransferase involved in cell wall biosynthesis
LGWDGVEIYHASEGAVLKIIFIFPRPAPYDSRSVRDFPSGGTEKAVIFLGEAFQKLGHTVSWITTLDQLEQPHDTPDVVITQHAEFLEYYPKSKRVFWSHHFADQPLTQQQAPYARIYADKIVTLSSCHASNLRSLLKLDSVTIGHGVWLNEVCTTEQKDPYRLIYASAPFRGLERVPALFKRVQDAEPRATIAICSSMATYGADQAPEDAKYRALFDELQSMEAVEVLGALNQAQLYEQYARASIFFYPCTWRETYCLAMDEAIAHGCVPVVPDIGALGERTFWCKTSEQKSEDNLLVTAAVVRMREFGAAIKYGGITQPRDWLKIAEEWQERVLQ